MFPRTFLQQKVMHSTYIVQNHDSGIYKLVITVHVNTTECDNSDKVTKGHSNTLLESYKTKSIIVPEH
jgi:hypothetical protein